MKLWAQCLALCIALCLSPSYLRASSQADKIAGDIQSAYRKNAEALRPHSNGFRQDGDLGTLILQDREWSLMAEWVAEYLNAHPAATAKELEAAIPQLDADLRGSAIELSPHTFVVAVQRVETGTFFILSQNAGVYRAAWNVKDFAATHDGLDDDISHWSARSPQPLYATLAELSNTESGSARFYVDATYAQEAGSTVHGQLSVWEWNGVTAAPILTGNYTYELSSDEPATFVGKLLRVKTKEEFKALFSCEMCIEPPGEWTIRITSRGVEDLGHRSLAPELDLIDNLFYRIQRRMPASNLAAPEVIDKLTVAIDDIRSDPSVTHDFAPSGMIIDWKVEHQDQHMRICLQLDQPELERSLFTLVRRSGKWFFTEARDVSDERKFGKKCSDVMRMVTQTR